MLPITVYKDVITRRGFKYHYYYVPAQGSRQTILFCHGFPSTSQDWHRIIPHFEQQGYGIIALDTLGYGGSDKPTDPAVYKGTLLAGDVVDIINAEKLDRVIAVGHDWGSGIVSRLANVAPERVSAYVFLDLAYVVPNPDADFEEGLRISKERFGYEFYGYQVFFASEEAAELIEKNWDIFFGLVFPDDPEIWKTDFAPLGALKRSLEEGKVRPLPSYLSQENKRAMSEALLAGGVTAPLCYYKATVRGFNREDDTTIPQSRYYPPTSSPIFMGAALRDRVGIAEVQKGYFTDPKFKNHDITIHDYDADHWLILSHAKEISEDLDKWLARTYPIL